MSRKLWLSVALCGAMALPVSAQQTSTTPPNSSAQETQIQVEPMEKTPVYRVNVVERTTQAVDYRDRGGTTEVDIRGTSLEPQVHGKAKITGHTGRLALDVNLRDLKSARTFGPEYLSYVLWAITPQGRATNLGEVIPNDDGNADLQLTTALQEFGLIVTAEPYFAVTRPSDLVVAENIVRPDTKGNIRTIDAKFDLLQRGQYVVDVLPDQLPATTADVKKVPLQLLEAENAVAIARAGGADRYAADTLHKAEEYLNQARDYYRRKQGRTPIGTVARAAAQSAEDARLLTLQRKEAEQVAAEQRATQERIERAQTQAEAETARAEEARVRARREAEQRQLAEQEAQAAENARQEAEQARREAEQQAQQLAQERQQTQQELQQAQAARQSAEQQQQALAQQAEQARLQAQQAEQENQRVQQQAEQQRQRLLQQLNDVLQTRESAKGLIVNMSDVLFDTGKATLKPGAKLKLAKLAGIILAYPDLHLEIDGYTDSTGSQQFNQVLSEKRAATVRDFLIAQGVPVNNVVAQGFGPSNPVASNETAAGRQQNRRVELVVSGTAIGTNVGAPGTNAGTTGGVTGNVTGTTSTQSPASSPAVATPTRPTPPPPR